MQKLSATPSHAVSSCFQGNFPFKSIYTHASSDSSASSISTLSWDSSIKKKHLQKQEFDRTCNGFQKLRMLPIWLLNPHPNHVSSQISYFFQLCKNMSDSTTHFSLNNARSLLNPTACWSAIQESSAVYLSVIESNQFPSSWESGLLLVWPYVFEAPKKATCHHPFCKTCTFLWIDDRHQRLNQDLTLLTFGWSW